MNAEVSEPFELLQQVLIDGLDTCETVEIKDGKVYIDGSETPLDDSFIPETMKGSFGPYQVPEDCYFMLGDNRNNSKDSRYWKNTYVRFDQIVGKAVIRYYPSIKLVQ